VRIKSLLLSVLLALFSAVVHASPALDATSGWVANCSPANTNILTFPALTTTQTQEAIIVSFGLGSVHVSVLSIADTAGLTYTRRAAITDGTDHWEEWYAPASGTLTSDVITATFTSTVPSGCLAGVAYGISGAAWPTPFDPAWGCCAQAKVAFGTANFNQTIGTDDLLLAHYGFNSCGATSPGSGWTSVIPNTNVENLIEYKVISGAQSGTTATVGSCGSNIASHIFDAFVSSAGLGVLEQSSKLNSYAVLQTGMGTSKDNMYVVVVPGIGTSKLNSYAIITTPATPVTQPGRGGLILHTFPP